MRSVAARLMVLALLVAPPALAERLEDRIATAADPSQHYALFEPDDASARTPVLIVLDPRGRGALGRDLALDGARARGWTIVSSWQSRSDTLESVTLRALDALLQESARLPHDPRRVYLAGMSGTAKTLWVVAPHLRGRIAGLIGSGGGRPPELPALAADAPPWFGFAGTTDFNFQEMHDLDAALANVGTPHRLDVFDGPHGWPDASGFVDAIAWHDLVAMRAKSMPRDDAWIDRRFVDCRVEAQNTRDALDRWRVLDRCARDFGGLRDVTAVRRDADALARTPGVMRLQKEEARLRSDEARQRKRFDAWRATFSTRFVDGREQPPPSDATTRRDLRIAGLRERATDEDPRVAASARRQLAWMHAAAASYLPPEFRARGDEARVAALKALAEATRRP